MFNLLRIVDEPFGGVGSAVEKHIFEELQKILRNLLIDSELSGIDDAHVEAGLDRVYRESRMHGLADGIVSAEGERNIANSAAHAGIGAGSP